MPANDSASRAWGARSTHEVIIGTPESTGYDLLAALEDIRMRAPEMLKGVIEQDLGFGDRRPELRLVYREGVSSENAPYPIVAMVD